MNDTIERSQTHATFVIERSYPVPVERGLARAVRQRRPRPVVRRRRGVRRPREVARLPRRRPRHRGRPVARRADVAIRVHLHRHRRPAADRVHLRHVGRRAAPVHLPDHDRAGARRRRDATDLHRAGRPLRRPRHRRGPRRGQPADCSTSSAPTSPAATEAPSRPQPPPKGQNS